MLVVFCKETKTRKKSIGMWENNCSDASPSTAADDVGCSFAYSKVSVPKIIYLVKRYDRYSRPSYRYSINIVHAGFKNETPTCQILPSTKHQQRWTTKVSLGNTHTQSNTVYILLYIYTRTWQATISFLKRSDGIGNQYEPSMVGLVQFIITINISCILYDDETTIIIGMDGWFYQSESSTKISHLHITTGMDE